MYILYILENESKSTVCVNTKYIGLIFEILTMNVEFWV